MLELLLLGHLSLERHTLSTTGDVVELHASLDLHGHGGASLCERLAGDADGPGDAPCQGCPESARPVLHGGRALPASAERTAQGLVTSPPRASRLGWLLAPKASPPRAS